MVKHYEMGSDHFEQTKGCEYYKRLTESIATVGLDAMSAFFMSLQVWGTPAQCYEKIKDIQRRTDCCGFTGVFSYAGMQATVARRNLELFAREVLPELKKLGSAPLFDGEVDGPPAFAHGAAKAA